MLDLAFFDKPKVPASVSTELLYYCYCVGRQLYGPRCMCAECMRDQAELQKSFYEARVCPNKAVVLENGREAAVELAAKFPEEATGKRDEYRDELIRQQFPRWDEK